MAFKRKDIEALGIDSDKVQILIDWHSETVKGLQTEIDSLKADNAKYADVKAQLDEANKTIKDADGYKTKYEAAKAELDSLKAENTEKELRAKKETAVKKLLSDMKIGEKWHGRIIKTLDMSKVELDKEDGLKDSDKLGEDIKAEWGDTVETTTIEGAKASTPPATNGKTTKSFDDIRKIDDDGARLQAMAENPSLFGL